MGKATAARYFIEILGKFFKTGSKEVADQIKKNNPRARVTTTAPKGVRVDTLKPPPKSLRQPQNPKTGKFQKPSPVPAKPKAPAKPPAKPSAPKSTSPAKPKTQTTAPAKPKTSTKAPAKPTGGTGGSRYTGKRGRKKAPLMDKKLVRSRPNLPPKPKTSRPAILRDSARPAAPEITKDDLKPVEKKKEGTPSKRLDTKPMTPKKSKPKVTPNKKTGENPGVKKKVSPGSSPKPKLRPATGPTTNESFKDAFRRNRKDKNATFTWKGKKYSTRYKEETVAEHKKKFGDY
jgi:hypothetical protein